MVTSTTYCLAVTYPTIATGSKYYQFYSNWKSQGGFWRNVTKMGTKTVSSGLAIWNTSGTYGPGIVSESLSYGMILAALYNDKITFDKLSSTLQAGIAAYSGKGLFPWYWIPVGGSSSTQFDIASGDQNSASDADINIALAYIYADQAKKVYGWTDPSSPNPSYKTMAQNYIAAIRSADFSSNDTNVANNYILADGWKQAISLFASNNWHPDYSDIRAYQLFQLYDSGNTAFWQNASTYTKSVWQSVFQFGLNDTGRTEKSTTGAINPALYWVKLSNATYQSLKGNSNYKSVAAIRGGSDPTYYTADSARMPIRLENYINAKDNIGTVDAQNMAGIAGSNLYGMGTSYTNTTYNYLVDKLNIGSPWSQYATGWIQNYQASGLFAYANDPNLKSYYQNQSAVYNSLNTKFGSNGINGSISTDITSQDGFNSSLTLWGLSVSLVGQTPLQSYILGINTSVATNNSTTSTTVAATYDASGRPAKYNTGPGAKKPINSVKLLKLNLVLHKPSAMLLVTITAPDNTQRIAYYSKPTITNGNFEISVPNVVLGKTLTSAAGIWKVTVSTSVGKAPEIKLVSLSFL